MTAWNTILDATFALNKPLTYILARVLRDNPVAIAEGSSGSPVIVGLNPKDIQTASGSATLTFTNIPALGLVEFELEGMRPATNGTTLQMQVSINNGSSWITSGYYFANSVVGSGGATGAEVGASVAQINLSKLTDSANSGSNGGSGIVRLHSNGSTAFQKLINYEFFHSATAGIFAKVVGGASAQNPTSAVNAVKFFYSSGNISAGTITMRTYRATVTN